MTEYECQTCGETFPMEPGDQEQIEAMIADKPHVNPERVGLTCEPCYQQARAQWDAMSESRRQALRGAHGG